MELEWIWSIGKINWNLFEFHVFCETICSLIFFIFDKRQNEDFRKLLWETFLCLLKESKETQESVAPCVVACRIRINLFFSFFPISFFLFFLAFPFIHCHPQILLHNFIALSISSRRSQRRTERDEKTCHNFSKSWAVNWASHPQRFHPGDCVE